MRFACIGNAKVEPQKLPSYTSTHLENSVRLRLSARETRTRRCYTYKPSRPISKSGGGQPTHRDAGTPPCPLGETRDAGRNKRWRWHQLPKYPEGGKSILRSIINGVALCIAVPVPLITIGVYIPRIPTLGRYKMGSARIDRVGVLWLDRAF